MRGGRPQPKVEVRSGVRGAVKKRILSEIDGIPGKFKIIVADEAATRIISSAMRLHDVMDHGVTLIEPITQIRQPIPSSPAVYIVAPTDDNVARLLADWEPRKMYMEAHILFISSASDAIIQKLGGSVLAQNVRNLKDLMLDFSVPETLTFCFDVKFDVPQFFTDNPNPSQLGKLSSQLITVLQALGESPFIRSQNTPLAQGVASRVEETLRIMGRVKSASDKQERGTLLIVDRSYDIVAPMVHELTYQAMLQDLLPLKDNCYEQEYTDRSGKKCKRLLPIDEEDPVWCKYRHEHISRCLSGLSADMKQLIEDNPALAQGMEKGAGLAALGEAVRTLPQFQEKQMRLSVHMDICEKLMNAFNIRALKIVCDVEQQLATGETGSGTKVALKELLKVVTAALQNPEIRNDDKLRILALLIATQGGNIGVEQRQELLHMFCGRGGAEEDRQILNLRAFGVSVEKERNPRKLVTASKPQSSETLELSRFETQAKVICEAAIRGTLDVANYPYVGETPQAAAAAAPKAAGGVSLRSGGRGSTAARSTCDIALEIGKERVKLESPARLILFVIGGTTFSETRSINEIARSLKAEVIIGSTSITTPTSFMETLSML